MKGFDDERLDVYVAALDFVTMADALANAASRGHGDLADQLRRASTSVLVNPAEGAGEFVPREKARFYRLAKRSGTESAALVEIYRRLGLIEPEVADKARSSLLRTVSMLVREAWASLKSFRPKGAPVTDSNGWSDFRGQTRSNEIHASTTDGWKFEGGFAKWIDASLPRASGRRAQAVFLDHNRQAPVCEP